MATKIFITGTTGYIGGDVMHALYQAHPDFEYTALVRNSDRGGVVAAAFPKVKFAYGTLDDSELLEKESAKADIVIHTADSSDHAGAAKAIAKGIANGHSKEKPGFWIHLGGAGILTWKDMESETYGEPPSQQPYDDLDRVSDLTSLPDSAFHRDIDKIVLGASSDVVKTAILCPPSIYGSGRGPGNQRSRQVNVLVKTTLEQGQTVVLGRGLTEWDNVNVHDLASLFVLLVEAAIAKKPDMDGKLWGKEGYYLVENGHHVWGELSKLVGKTAFDKGYIKEKDTKAMTPDEAKEAAGFEALSWGMNSKGFAKRAREYLGWKPTGRSLEDEIPFIVDGEAEHLGIKKGHAEKAAGQK
ncbi:related to nucleoside-diphosphate-sugar epimerase [Rhynchosporium agropyri]|uniref:Related to nucleoside-diphosphate-sugar epimerase n=1 Tax=Rhynchosporium agropyri TaxID=914238 RepID=A0A1E1JTI7_9HELO|nr:related to nucleoside-diphosphate-sugar epimerase [Rhynchosporium agropyri]